MENSIIIEEQLKKFFDTFGGNYVGAFGFQSDANGKMTQHPEEECFVHSWSDFLKFCRNNQGKMLYSCYRRLKPLTTRNMNNVVSSKYFFIDIDDKTQDERFLALIKSVGLKYQFKADSGGGFHYFIPHNLYEISNDTQMERLKTIATLFRDFFIDNDVAIDKKVFDLARYSRPWGTFNYRRNRHCQLLEEVKLEQKDIDFNTDFIFNLKPKYSIEYKSPHTIINHCKLIERALEYNFEYENPEAFVNDVLLKNSAAYIIENQRHEKEAFKIATTQHHPIAEMEGWLKRAKTGGLKFNCFEMRKFLKTYYPNHVKELCHHCMLENKNNVLYLNDENQSFSTLKDEYRSVMKLPVNRYYKLQGEISLDDTYMRTYVIGKTYLRRRDDDDEEEGTQDGEMREITPADILESEIDTYIMRYFGERKLSRQEMREARLVPMGDIKADFYTYKFCHGGRCYKMISEVELETGEAFVEGNMVQINDKYKIGEEAKVDTYTNVLLVHNTKSVVAPYTDWEFVFNDFNYEEQEIEDFIFHYKITDHEQYILDQPEMFKWLIKAFVFSGKRENYPLHLVLVGPAGSGKSWQAEALHQKMGELGSVVDAGTSTVKGFIPASPSGKYSSGCIYRAKRLLAVDEFFILFLNMQRDEHKEELMQKFNNIMMNKVVESTTGYGRKKESLTCKTIWTSNPLDTEAINFIKSVKKFPEPSMQRFLFYNQSRRFVDFIAKVRKMRREIPDINRKRWLSLWDFMMTEKSVPRYDESKVIEIIDRYKNICPESLLFLYDHRTVNHHALLVFEGLAKWRILFEKDKTVTANQRDYELFESVWADLVEGWAASGKEAGPSRNAGKLMALIPNDGISLITLYKRAAELFNMTNPSEETHKDNNHPIKLMIKELRRLKLIKNGEGGQINSIFRVVENEVKPSEMDFSSV